MSYGIREGEFAEEAYTILLRGRQKKLCRRVADKVLTFAGVVIGVGFTLVALAMGAKPRCWHD